MFDFIKGKIVDRYKNNIVVYVNSIGYKIVVANPFTYEIDSDIKVFIYQYVREDLIELYGFKSKEEREFFIKLISVKGIGPKSGLAILAGASYESIEEAIEAGNSYYLQKFPGIGAKTASQIILDLKNKLITSHTPKLIEVKEVLMSLGYKSNEFNKISKNLSPHKDVNVLVKDALKMLLK